jgi:hypothetical protein
MRKYHCPNHPVRVYSVNQKILYGSKCLDVRSPAFSDRFIRSNRNAQDFIPNKAPVVDAFGITYAGTDKSFDSTRLYAGMPFQITVTASDPENGKITYELASKHPGTFSSWNISDSGATSGTAPSRIYCEAGNAVTIPSQGSLSNASTLVFSGWDTLSSGMGVRYDANGFFGDKLIQTSGEIKLYAQWTIIFWTAADNWSASCSSQGNTASTSSQWARDATNTKGLILTYDNNWTSYSSGAGTWIWVFTRTASQTGCISFKWQYSGNHAYAGAYAKLEYFEGTTFTILLASTQVYNGFVFDSAGIVTIHVTSGKTYGFRIAAKNGDSTGWLFGNVILSGADFPSL